MPVVATLILAFLLFVVGLLAMNYAPEGVAKFVKDHERAYAFICIVVAAMIQALAST